MTIKEFDSTQWGKGMRAVHNTGGPCLIIGVELFEKLLEVVFDDNLGNYWCRCENITLIDNP